MPKISVILPNYNYARYLDERIQGILNQTFKDFELIIIDDASTDNSLEVIQKYTSDPRIKTKFFKKNSGTTYQRWNDGADMAIGQYLLFAGADDNCDPTLLDKLARGLDSHPSAGIAYAQSWFMDTAGKFYRSGKTHTDEIDPKRWENDFFDKGINELRYMATTNVILTASAVLIRADLFRQAGKFDIDVIIVSDYVLWCKLLKISDVVFIAEKLNYFRQHSGSVAKKFVYDFFAERFKGLPYGLSLETKDVLKKKCAETTQEYAKFICYYRPITKFDKVWKTYQQAKKIDPFFPFHLFIEIIIYCFKKLINSFRVQKH